MILFGIGLSSLSRLTFLFFAPFPRLVTQQNRPATLRSTMHHTSQRQHTTPRSRFTPRRERIHKILTITTPEPPSTPDFCRIHSNAKDLGSIPPLLWSFSNLTTAVFLFSLMGNVLTISSPTSGLSLCRVPSSLPLSSPVPLR
jgi:hypothetical protein